MDLKGKILVSIGGGIKVKLDCVPLFLLIAALTVVSVQGQITSGTIIVFGRSGNKFYVAADSREGKWGQHDDNYCKIASLDGRLLFTATGMIGYDWNPNPFFQSWTAQGLAREVFHSVNHEPSYSVDIEATATQWVQLAKIRIQDILMTESGADAILKSMENNQVLGGVFAGVDPNGKLRVYKVAIYIDSEKLRKRELVSPEILPIEEDNFPVPIESAGKQSIVNEYLEGQTKQAQQWKKELSSNRKFSKIKDSDVRLAVQLVDLTIRNVSSDEVGGPIDAASLSSTGKVVWFQRKDSCPVN